MTPGSFESAMAAFRQRLAGELPGHGGAIAERPDARGGIDAAKSAGCREAAALVLLFPGATGPATVLTLRNADMRHHAGQVSLPGGALEDGESVEQAARRELHEELGLAARLTFAGRLSPLYIPPSGFCLSPVVAGIARRPRFEPDPQEVAEVLEVGLDELANPSARRDENRLIGGELRSVPYYQVGGHKVWGATGLVVRELVALWVEIRRQL